MPYLTPDAPPGTTICRTIVIPDDLQWKAIVNGALGELFKAYNFEEYGDLTPEETAAIFLDMWSDYHESECTVIPIGMVAAFTSPDGSMPPKWIYADGQTRSRTTYAALFALYGEKYGAGDGSTSFNIPDLRGRFVYGVGVQNEPNMYVSGGEVQHTLTTLEMPAHHHQEHVDLNSLAWQPGGSGSRHNISTGALGTSGTALITEDTGGGSPHNNMPPYRTLAYGIYAGV